MEDDQLAEPVLIFRRAQTLPAFSPVPVALRKEVGPIRQAQTRPASLFEGQPGWPT